MRKDLQDKLFFEFPEFFEYRDQNLRPFYPIVFGIECMDGWFNLIYNLFKDIKLKWEEYKNLYPDKKILPPQICQIKEKFGGLRFQIDSNSTKLDIEYNSIVEVSEIKSYSICEFCGSEDSVGRTSGYWVYTVCNHCFNTNEKFKFKDQFKWVKN